MGLAARSVADAKGGWGARVPSVSRINARRLRGNRNDLIAHGLSNLLVVEPATALRVSSRGHEPKIKPAQGRFDFWLCSVCSSRTELLEIGREIDELKDKLGLAN